jgi:hypothetical protein
MIERDAVRRFDGLLSVAVLGTLAPVSLMLLLWWGSLPFTDDPALIYTLAAAGLVLGLLLDLTLLRRHLKRLYSLSLPVLVVLEVFYDVLVYGFFMGLPVFNVFVGILWSYIVARKLRFSPGENGPKTAGRMIWFSAAALFLLCVCSAVLALSDSTICSQVKGMLGLPFDVTLGMIWALIVGGGAALLVFQYFISKLVTGKILAR